MTKDNLKKENYHNELTLYEFQKELKRYFFLFLDFLEKNNIKYSLAYGTMLGACREGDIIKWDFDIDIFILDEDVRNNIKLLDSFDNEDFYFHSWYKGNGVIGESRMYIKKLKVYRPYKKEGPYEDAHIDIFHYRRNNNSLFNTKEIKKIQRVRYYSSIKGDKDYSKNIIKNIAKHILVPFLPGLTKTNKKLLNIFDNISRYDPDYFFIMLPEECLKIIQLKSDNYIKISFSNRECYAFEDYRKYLVYFYGNEYMIPRDDGRSSGAIFFKINQ